MILGARNLFLSKSDNLKHSILYGAVYRCLSFSLCYILYKGLGYIVPQWVLLYSFVLMFSRFISQIEPLSLLYRMTYKYIRIKNRSTVFSISKPYYHYSSLYDIDIYVIIMVEHFWLSKTCGPTSNYISIDRSRSDLLNDNKILREKSGRAGIIVEDVHVDVYSISIQIIPVLRYFEYFCSTPFYWMKNVEEDASWSYAVKYLQDYCSL
jgi:hypothetical protein